MRHFASPGFWACFRELPGEIQALANRSFHLLKQNPRHPSLRLKKVGPYWSVRVGRDYRALGKSVEGGILWAWIGSHRVYDKRI